METEHIHSTVTVRHPSGRDPAPSRLARDPEPVEGLRGTLTNYVNAPPRSRPHPPIPRATRLPTATWLNLVCLDAPLVSIIWLWLFARTFQGHVTPAAAIALFLTAWLIYLADRLADSRSLPKTSPRSLRHIFCGRHQLGWFAALVVVALADTAIVWNGLSADIRIAGSAVGIVAVIHLLMNYSLGGAWPPLPLKEFAVGSLFVLGTLVPLLPIRSMTNTL